jgi:hypothetical protein
VKPRTSIIVAAVAAVTASIVLGVGTGQPPVAGSEHPQPALHEDTILQASRWAVAGQSLAASTPLPGPWCGDFRASDNLTNEVAQGGPKFHMVIAVPADVAANPNHQLTGQRALADDAFETIKTLEAYYSQRLGVGNIGESAKGWTLRFDYGTNCAAQFPDISFYTLPRTRAQYGNDPFLAIEADLDASNLYERSNKRYVVHYVGQHPTACGQSRIYASTDATGGAKYSIAYNYDQEYVQIDGVPFDGGGTEASFSPCGWEVDAHEMGHSLGAATGGPSNLDGAHTWDCQNDVMSYGGATCGDGVLYFDWHENNYFGHTGTWNDTDQSAYWCKPTC